MRECERAHGVGRAIARRRRRDAFKRREPRTNDGANATIDRRGRMTTGSFDVAF